jgi:hypothetical protein
MKLPPIAVACLSALAIDSCSNVIAQRLKAWNESNPFVFDRVLFFQFAFMVVLTAPINFHWQCWLERTFPGKTVKQERRPGASEEEKGMVLKDDGEDKKMVEEDIRVRDWWNIFRKWFTDCITMGALLNQSMFLILMGFLKHKTVALIVQDFRNVSSAMRDMGVMVMATIANAPQRSYSVSYSTRTKSGLSPTSFRRPISLSRSA